MAVSETETVISSGFIKQEMISPDSTTTIIGKTGRFSRPKRKYKSRARQRSPETVKKAKKQRRTKANDRERRRMHSLNQALEQLRGALPQLPEDSKMTKIETLRMANNYILALTELLKVCETEQSDNLKVDNSHLEMDYESVETTSEKVWMNDNYAPVQTSTSFSALIESSVFFAC